MRRMGKAGVLLAGTSDTATQLENLHGCAIGRVVEIARDKAYQRLAGILSPHIFRKEFFPNFIPRHSGNFPCSFDCLSPLYRHPFAAPRCNAPLHVPNEGHT